MKQKRAILLRGLTAASLLLAVAGSAAAQSLPQCWSAAGTSTALNPLDLDSADFNGPLLAIDGPATLPVTLHGRLSISGIFQDNGSVAQAKLLGVRYRDNGPESQIYIELRQVNVATGAISTIATFDSNVFAAGNGFQFNQVSTACGFGGGFDFINYMYFLTVSVTRTGSNGNPSLGLTRVCTTPC